MFVFDKNDVQDFLFFDKCMLTFIQEVKTDISIANDFNNVSEANYARFVEYGV